MLEPTKVLNEMKALQKHFMEKRDYVISRLRNMGFHIKTVPDSTFYLWLDLEGLPEASTTFILISSLFATLKIYSP
jgi:aspartate/methionine/tyrosine aminotransferase